jgi:hypothetical protein
MLVVAGGRERTAAEFHGLFQQSGFALTEVSPTAAEVSLLEGELA